MPQKSINQHIVKSLILFSFLLIGSCKPQKESKKYRLEVYQTSFSGDNLKLVSTANNSEDNKASKKVNISIHPEVEFQKYYGFGASFTESSAWNLATIPTNLRKDVLNKLFSPTKGVGFSLTRTHINSSDYSNNHYTYVDENDLSLSTFSINEDLKGFTGNENNQVKNIALEEPNYDLIPMIKEALAVEGADFKLIASPWSPPSWMKSNETSPMTNGSLLPKYYPIWAEYLSKYVSAYKEEGINIWGLTPQNEPLHYHDARWDSNGFTPEQGRDFLKNQLGPQFVKDGHLNTSNLNEGVKIIIYDHNKSVMNNYANTIYNDAEANKYAWGTGFHWYANSELKANNYYAHELDKLHKNWPKKAMIHTESSIDLDVKDPIGQYWRESTDYAGKFIPFETYAYDIITDLNHGTQGYIEWCMILSNEGKPNPYDNFNSAPVLINPNTDEVIYTPLYYLLGHFSKFIRPNAVRIDAKSSKIDGIIYTTAKNKDGSLVLVIYNNNKDSFEISLNIENDNYSSIIEAKAMQTIVLK